MNPHFERMKLSEKYKNSEGLPRLEEIISSEKYTHFYPKFDGTHIDLEITLDRNITMLTREGNDVAHLVPYLVESLKDSEIPHGTYACEAVHISEVVNNPRNSWSLSRRVLGRKDYDDTLPQIQLIIYDCYEQRGESYKEAPLAFRTLCLLPRWDNSIETSYNHLALPTFIQNILVPRCYTIDTLQDKWKEFVLDNKLEGFVLFNFENEECPFNETFTKLKPPMNLDAIVLGYHAGKKGTRLEGKVGAFEVGLIKDDGNGKVTVESIGKVPTMPDSERVKWTERMSECALGKDKYYVELRDFVIEINASEVTVNNKLRFPSYLRERTDKGTTECLWEQLV